MLKPLDVPEYGLHSRLLDDSDLTDLLALPPRGFGRVVALMRLEIDDAVTDPLCLEINGMIFDINDPRISLYDEVHPNCRGDWAYMFDTMHPQVTASTFKQPSAKLLAEHGGDQFITEIGTEIFRNAKGKTVIAEQGSGSMDELLDKAIKDSETRLTAAGYAKSIGADPELWVRLTLAEKREFLLRRGK